MERKSILFICLFLPERQADYMARVLKQTLQIEELLCNTLVHSRGVLPGRVTPVTVAEEGTTLFLFVLTASDGGGNTTPLRVRMFR